MGTRILAALFAFSLTAIGQTLTIEKLRSFVESSAKMIAEGKMTDRDLAKYLANVKLSERLDDRTIEQMEGAIKIPPKTLQALQALRDRSQTLAAATPIVANPTPVLPPPPSSFEQAAIINAVRQYALSYSKRL